jgi:1,4-alpha-glucan branching enzyme
MLNCIGTFMLVKKIYLICLLTLACQTKEDPQPTAPVIVAVEEPKQFGTPFAGVPDPQDVVMYEVNLRSFSEAGNFQGVIDRLDNIKALGVNTIWLMPIHPVGKIKSAGGDGSPYAVQNYLQVNSEFGDMAKLREFVTIAHEKGMAVIIDWVANHTSWDNPWISNRSWYTQNAQGEIISPAGFNWTDVADLNFNNREMRKAMIHAMKYWILEANLDGVRCDAADHVPADFWKEALASLNKIDGRKLILLAEGGKAEHFTSGFQMNYAWNFYYNLKDVYGKNKSAATIFTTHQEEFAAIPAGATKLRYTTNHDESGWEGTPIQFFGGKTGALSASVVTIFISAVPLLYNGQEVGRAELLPFFTGDPIDWTENQEMLDEYTKLMSIYNETPAFRKGTLAYFSNPDVVMYTRTFEDETYLILVNVRNATKEVVLDDALQGTTWSDRLNGGDIALTDKITLLPYAYKILKK